MHIGSKVPVDAGLLSSNVTAADNHQSAAQLESGAYNFESMVIRATHALGDQPSSGLSLRDSAQGKITQGCTDMLIAIIGSLIC